MHVLYLVDSEQVLVERRSGDYLSLVRSGPWLRTQDQQCQGLIGEPP
jgi:hypothetical protein